MRPQSLRIQSMNTRTRFDRFAPVGVEHDTGIGSARYCGSTSTSSPCSSRWRRPTAGAWISPSREAGRFVGFGVVHRQRAGHGRL